ncbi:MAG TPA: BamA/TamA family outer membrane protein [Vitreimonas sp.]|uniref:autotransporter assembly complex protein TamA n=1 Tax=Vitreimonas sp. TaxID=3069702 RepID=UPI002D47DFEF|nr:BamA/TamA family outer membrane protein [Vitreimonas sp.]HYD89720.1 BamA/TamA family outer membrane protein [Vitreimonas sp.]
MRLLPVLPAAMAAAISLAAPSAAWADSPVLIDGGDEDMRDTLRELLPDRDPPESLFDAERIAEEAAERAMVWLRSEGYYGATVTPEATEEPPAARLVIAPGPRFSFTAPEIEFVGDPPDSGTAAEARRAIGAVSPGAPARAGEVLTAEAEALAALQSGGYPDATPRERRVVVDHAATSVAADFRFDAGARARLGGLSAEPADVFRPGFIDDLQNWATGDIYTPDALARLRRDLSSTGAVSRVSTRLGEPNANGVREVILDIEPARRNAYELGVSYSTSEGPGVVGEWTRRNFTGRADALTIGSTLAEQQQDFSVELARPHAAGLGHTVTVGAGVEREAPAAYTRTGASVYASVDASTRLRLGRSYGVTLTASQYDDLLGPVSEAVVLSGFYALRHDTTEFTLDPLDGSTVDLRVEPSVSSGDETLGFVRLIGEGRVYESFGREDSLTLAARIRGGWLEALAGDADDVPPDRRFYAGGGGSVRGYDYNSIFPLDRVALGLTPGGQGLLEGSVEVRWRFGARLGAVAFVDAGAAFDDWQDAGDLAIGVGVGARYDLGFAPLRVDVALPLDDEFAADDYALYISIGQAF